MKISILMASYNYDCFIKQAIDSVLDQTYSNWELIVIDDGSKDNSVEVIKEYCKNFPDKIFLYQHENNLNKGLSQTLELGLKNATGDYIAFLESDDYWAENYLEEKIVIIKKFPEVKFIFNATKLFGDEEVVKDHYKNTADNLPIEQKVDTYAFMPFAFLDMNIVGTFSSMLIEKNILKKCKFNTPYGPYLDWWICHQIALKHKIYYVNKQLTFWRLHKKSYTNEKYDRKNQAKKENYYRKFYENYIKELIFLKLDFFKKIQLLFFLCLKWLTVSRWCNKIFRGLIVKLRKNIVDPACLYCIASIFTHFFYV
jgi:glycosyltransferase involved in cell wall biosynthesis